VTLLLAMLLAEQEKQVDSDRKLRESENRYRTLFEKAVDAIFVSDFDGNLLNINPVACASLGYTREELLALRIQDVDSNVPTREMLHQFCNSIFQMDKPAHLKVPIGEKVEAPFPWKFDQGL